MAAVHRQFPAVGTSVAAAGKRDACVPVGASRRPRPDHHHPREVLAVLHVGGSEGEIHVHVS